MAIRHQQYSSVMCREVSRDEVKADKILCIKLSQFLNLFDIVYLLRNVSGFEQYNLQTKIFASNQIYFRQYMYKLNFVVCVGIGNIFFKIWGYFRNYIS